MTIIKARMGLLDALETLGSHRDAVVLVGAQALYSHTSHFKSSIAEFTQDADLAFRPELLTPSPLLEVALAEAGFTPDIKGQPGRWISPGNIPVDFMVPERLVGTKKRSAGINPHARNTARNTRGIEGCLVDNEIQMIQSLESSDRRAYEISVAGPASLLIAKTIKISERLEDRRILVDKDAHDIYRLLSAVPIATFNLGFSKLTSHSLSKDITEVGLVHFEELFARGSEAEGSMRAGQAEFGFGNPDTVSQSVAFLARDLLEAL
jgi:hypothetical protein